MVWTPIRHSTGWFMSHCSTYSIRSNIWAFSVIMDNYKIIARPKQHFFCCIRNKSINVSRYLFHRLLYCILCCHVVLLSWVAASAFACLKWKIDVRDKKYWIFIDVLQTWRRINFQVGWRWVKLEKSEQLDIDTNEI